MDRANVLRLSQLSTPLFQFVCEDSGTVDDAVLRDRLLESVLAPKVLNLRVGAQVSICSACWSGF